MPTSLTTPVPAERTLDPLLTPSAELATRVDADIGSAGGEMAEDPRVAGAVGVTLFDLPGSEDHTVTVLLQQENLQRLPSQALVRIKSRTGGDGRTYLGLVTAGPFAEPDSLRGDSHLLVTVAA